MEHESINSREDTPARPKSLTHRQPRQPRSIDRSPNAKSTASQDMGVQHRSPDNPVRQQLLHRQIIGASFETLSRGGTTVTPAPNISPHSAQESLLRLRRGQNSTEHGTLRRLHRLRVTTCYSAMTVGIGAPAAPNARASRCFSCSNPAINALASDSPPPRSTRRESRAAPLTRNS